MDPLTLAMLGTAGAGALGNIFGAMGQGDAMARNIEAQNRLRQQLIGDLKDVYGGGATEMKNLYAPLAGMTGTGMELIQQDYGVETPTFDYEGKVEDFLDASIDYQTQQATRQIESGAAARGGVLSGAAQKAIADRSQQIGEMGYADAYGRMMQDKSMQFQQTQQDFMNRVQEAQRRYGQSSDILQAGMGGLGGQAQGIMLGTEGLGKAMTALGPGQATAGLNSLAFAQGMQGLGGGLMNFAGQLMPYALGK